MKQVQLASNDLLRERSWLRPILTALDEQIVALLACAQDAFDETDDREDLVGVGFVALQTYIAGSLSSIRSEAAKQGLVLSFHELRKKHSPTIAAGTLTYVEVVWLGANYYKHRDEWPADWNNATGLSRRTIAELASLGISQRSRSRGCHELMRLMPETRWSLTRLLEILSGWRTAWVGRLLEEHANVADSRGSPTLDPVDQELFLRIALDFWEPGAEDRSKGDDPDT